MGKDARPLARRLRVHHGVLYGGGTATVAALVLRASGSFESGSSGALAREECASSQAGRKICSECACQFGISGSYRQRPLAGSISRIPTGRHRIRYTYPRVPTHALLVRSTSQSVLRKMGMPARLTCSSGPSLPASTAVRNRGRKATRTVLEEIHHSCARARARVLPAAQRLVRNAVSDKRQDTRACVST